MSVELQILLVDPASVRSELISFGPAVLQHLDFIPVCINGQYFHARPVLCQADGLVFGTRIGAKIQIRGGETLSAERVFSWGARSIRKRIPACGDIPMRGEQHPREKYDKSDPYQESRALRWDRLRGIWNDITTGAIRRRHWRTLIRKRGNNVASLATLTRDSAVLAVTKRNRNNNLWPCPGISCRIDVRGQLRYLEAGFWRSLSHLLRLASKLGTDAQRGLRTGRNWKLAGLRQRRIGQVCPKLFHALLTV